MNKIKLAKRLFACMLVTVACPIGITAGLAGLSVGVASAKTIVLCGWAGCEGFVLGPRTPRPRSSPHMRFHIRPSTVKAGTTLHATAKGFLRHEYVAIWDYHGHRLKHSSELNGGFANAHGKLKFIHETFAHITKTGRHKICLQGQRSKRVACAVYRVKSAGPAVEHGYTPPSEEGGYTPPSEEGGYTPPSEEGGYTPPSEEGGYTPPSEE